MIQGRLISPLTPLHDAKTHDLTRLIWTTANEPITLPLRREREKDAG